MRYVRPFIGAVPGALVVLLSWATLTAQVHPLGVSLARPVDGCALEGPADDEPLPVLVTAGPGDLREPGWLEALASCAPQRHLDIVVRLDPPVDWLAEPDPYGALDGWAADLDAFFRRHPGTLKRFELGDRPDLVFPPDAYAYLLERVGTLLQAAEPDAELAIGAVAASSESWLHAVGPERIAPYVQGLAVAEGDDARPSAERFAGILPGAARWLHLASSAGEIGSWLSRMHAARGEGFSRIIASAEEPPEIRDLVSSLARALPARFEVDLDPPRVDPSMHYYADPLGPERALLASSGAEGAAAGVPSGASRVRRFDLTPGGEGPALLRYIVEREPRPVPETVGVTEEAGLTAEEIIARHRVFEAAQTRGLSHYQSKATISFHYRAESFNESIDVASVNRFFWRDGVGEYEETDLFVNGARWRGKPPSLPFVAAEKVKEVPLEIRLDQSYRYVLRDTEKVDGRSAYVIAFEPVEADRALYSGEAWIDAATFARLKVRFLQHALKEPITSSEDTIVYGEAGGWWIPVSAYRQMVFTVLGRSVAVERRVKWEEFEFNAPLFDQNREQAYASGRPVLRDDETGYTYMVKEGGVIRARPAESLRNVALFGGIGFNSDLNPGTPFAGLNYFDFNWRGTGTQLDVAFGGPLINVAWTDPAVAKTRWEISVEARAAGLPDNFKKVIDSGRRREEDLKVLEERLYFTVSHRLGAYQKLDLQTELDYDNFTRGDDADPDFVLPPTRLSAILTPRWRYIRSGWSVELWFSQGRRFGWGDWGIPAPPDPNLPRAPAGDPAGGSGDDLSFQRWGMGVLKSFYPARTHKVSMGGALFSGRDLDRFSRFRIGEFRNARVRGFNSFDITFERGALAQVSWRLTLPRGGLSLDAGLEGAVIENEEDFSHREYLAGGGLGLSFTGPWGTLMSLRSGFGLGQSIDVSPGGASLRLIVIKTWDHWPFHLKRRDGADPVNPS